MPAPEQCSTGFFRRLGLAVTGLDGLGRLWVLDVAGSLISYNTISGAVQRYPFQSLTSMPRPWIRASDGKARCWLALDTAGTVFRFDAHTGDTGRLHMPWRVKSLSYNGGYYGVRTTTHRAVHSRTGASSAFS
jgi:hypothetical protein